MKKIFLLLALMSSFLLFWCSKKMNTINTNVSKLEVNLPFDVFPVKYTCEWEDISPEINLSWYNEQTKYLAIILEDPDAPIGTFTHWLITNIPITNKIPENIPKTWLLSWDIVQWINDFWKIWYNGPCPPPWPAHHYYLKVFWLKNKINLEVWFSKEKLLESLSWNITQYGEYIALFGR